MKVFFAVQLLALSVLITEGCSARNNVIRDLRERQEVHENDGTYDIIGEGTYLIREGTKNVLICIVLSENEEPCLTEEDIKRLINYDKERTTR